MPETYQECADVVNRVWHDLGLDIGKKALWKYSDINNAKRPRSVEPGTFQPEPGLTALADRLCDAFSVNNEDMRRHLFSAELFLYHVAPIARDVVIAILNGPRLGIPPFPELSDGGVLPTRSRLVEVFGHLVSGIERISYEDFPDKRDPADQAMVQQLFRRAGLDGKAARLATGAIIPAMKHEWKPEQNPRRKKCLEVFVQALHQPDLLDVRPESKRVLAILRRFGLTESIYCRIQNEKFVGGSLRRTAEESLPDRTNGEGALSRPGEISAGDIEVGGDGDALSD